MRRWRTLILAVVAVAGGVLSWQRLSATIPAGTKVASPLVDDSVVSLRVRFGVKDTEPSSWDGSASTISGEILELRNWRPRPGDEIRGKTEWSLSTREGPNFRLRPWEEQRLIAPVKYLLVPGVIVDVHSLPGTSVHFKTAKGEFVVRPAEVSPAEPLSFLNGNVIVDRVPTAQVLSTDGYENDFATLLHGPSGEVWVAWVAYRGKGNDVLARRLEGESWGEIQRVTPETSDVFLVKMGWDRSGKPWAIWSAQVSGNWDLYARRFNGQSWGAIERLTEDPQPDIFHTVTTDRDGNLWVTWQGFRRGGSDIFARRFDGSRWLVSERISTSPANDWEPAIAADAAGRVYVAWDTYDRGNYDVLMRRFAGGRWEDPVAVADSLKFEAHVSLACDRENRLWAAWNETGMQWGKDSGFLVKPEATRLYEWRHMGVAVYGTSGWQEPVANINASLPEELSGYNDFPIIQVDPSGRPWVFFRHRTLRIRDTPSNTPAHRAAWEICAISYEGDRWSTPVRFPFSQGRADMRSGFALDDEGSLYAAWVTDNRDFEEFLFQHAEVYAGRFPALSPQSRPAQLRQRVIPELTEYPVHPNEARDLERIREYTIQSAGKTYRIYRGDTHRHTEFSMDGNNEGSLWQTYRYAMDAVDLDYLGVTEHNHAGGPDIEYINWLLQQAVDLMTLPGSFTALYAYERSLPYPNGHRNILFARRGNPTLPIPQGERQGETGAEKLYQYLKRYQGIAISHTSATNMGTDWRDNDPELEPLVEIYQGDRVSAEYEGAPRAAWGGDPRSAPGGFRPAGYVWNAWAKGYKLGVQAASDHLSNHISYACTLATDSTRDGLLDAMRKRHSYAATDNIILDYRLKANGTDYLQGDIVSCDGNFRLWVKVIGTSPIRQIDVVKNNTFLHTTHPLEREVEMTFLDSQPSPGESYYYVRIIQVDGQIAWSSPIWIQRP